MVIDIINMGILLKPQQPAPGRGLPANNRLRRRFASLNALAWSRVDIILQEAHSPTLD